MITTELWNGQGCGNQLACAVTTRCIALHSGYDFGIGHPERFKAKFLKNFDFGKPVVGGYTPVEGQTPLGLPDGIEYYYREATQLHPNGSNISGYDWNLFNLPDNTKIDGLMQGEQYFSEWKEQIRDWLKVDLLPMDDNMCYISFRGGEYVYVPDFFLPQSYWDNAIANMRSIRSDMEFRVVTDDVVTARRFFPDFEITHEMSNDYIVMQSAPYTILSNSSFPFFAVWLNTNLKVCIAPRYWGRYNLEIWSLDQNYTEGWYYQDKKGNLDQRKNIQ